MDETLYVDGHYSRRDFGLPRDFGAADGRYSPAVSLNSPSPSRTTPGMPRSFCVRALATAGYDDEGQAE